MRGNLITLTIEDPATPGSYLSIAGQRVADSSDTSEVVDQSSKGQAHFVGTPGRIGSLIQLAAKFDPADPGQVAIETNLRAGSSFRVRWLESALITRNLECVCTSLEKVGPNQAVSTLRAVFRVVGDLVLPMAPPFETDHPNSFDMGTDVVDYVIETDAIVSAMLTDPNSAGFSFGVWYKLTPFGIVVNMSVCGSSDSWSTYTEGTALTGHGTPDETTRFFVEDWDDAKPQNWTETAENVTEDEEWHFSLCVWDPFASGSRRVRHYFDGSLNGAGGNHPGDLSEPWDQPWWWGRGHPNVFDTVALRGYLTHGTLWDGPCSDDEALAIWGDGKPPNLSLRTGFTQNLVLWYYPLGYTPGLGSVVTDHSGSGNHGTDAGDDSPVGLVADIP